MTGFKVPVALFNFNRPHLTRQVFEVIRRIKPQRLLLVADGPRADKPDDARLCADVRAIFEQIDWPCEVSRNFADINLGSFKRNSSGLDWVFETVEEAIILEDDCIPSLSFFPYCEELLARYRDDARIGVVSGNSFAQPKGRQRDASYYFSAYALTWGWASWRRVWKQVDLSMSWWEPGAVREILNRVHANSLEQQYWYSLYESIHRGAMKNAWDYQLILSSFRHSQLCVCPAVNLVSNLGYGPGATHCVDGADPLSNLPRGNLVFPLRHPVSISRSSRTDHLIFRARILPLPTFYRRALGSIRRAVGSLARKIRGVVVRETLPEKADSGRHATQELD